MKLELDIPQELVIMLVNINPNDVLLYYRNICSIMFIAGLFIIARSQEQTRCPSTDEWIWKMWYIYTMGYYSAVKHTKKL